MTEKLILEMYEYYGMNKNRAWWDYVECDELIRQIHPEERITPQALTTLYKKGVLERSEGKNEHKRYTYRYKF